MDNFDMSKGGVKNDSGKPRMDLLPMEALFEIADVFGFGAAKYKDWNWCKGMRWGRLLAAALRHIYQFLGGEDLDKESGKSHLAHAGCCILMCLSLVKRGNGEDDRYKEEPSPLGAGHYNLVTALSKSIDGGDPTSRTVYGLPEHCGAMPCLLCEIKHTCDYYNACKR